MWCSVGLVRTDVLEEHVSVFRVERIHERETALAVENLIV
jgi:hypothetical protein